MKRDELLKRPNYLLTLYQNEIYRQLVNYMETEKLETYDVAKKLNVSKRFVQRLLNGNANCTLKKLIKLSIMMGKVPDINFISPEEYWANQEKKLALQS